MKQHKFNFMKGCGYASKNGVLSFKSNGAIFYSKGHESIAYGRIENDLSWLCDSFYVCGLENNSFTKFGHVDYLLKLFYKQIFERISDT